jgi:hypothetical protein
MFAISVPQSYSRLFLTIYNAPAVPGRPLVCPSKFNKKDAVRKAKPVNAGEAKLRVKAASRLSLQGCQMDSVQLPRMSGSFDFYRVPLSDIRTIS